jgi:hypothetical protein
MNFGTTTKIFTLSPSAECPAQRCMVEAGRKYAFPSPNFFPSRYSLVERGPGGWEHFVLIVSDGPVFGPEHGRGEPIVEIDRPMAAKKIADLFAKEASWAVGVLSFEVTD